MKKGFCVRLLSVLLMSLVTLGSVLVMNGCSSKTKLYVFNCGDYIAPGVIEAFEEQYPEYTVVYEQFDTNETMYQKFVSTNTPYDILIPSDYMIERLIEEERLLKIDTASLENYSKIRDTLKNTSYDPNNEYSVPYMWGTLGIVYNKTKVTGTIDSWDVLWDEQYKGQILMLDSVRDTMALSLLRLSYDMNSVTPSEIEQAGQELLKQKELVAQYGVDDIKQPMIGGHYALCVEWSGDALWMMNQNEDLEYVIPKEGTNRWIDAMVIPNTSKNYDGAVKFIDFMCSTEIAYENTSYIEYSTPQVEALELLGDEYINNHVFNPSDEELANTDSFHHLGDSIDLYNKEWEKVRLAATEDDSDISPWIIVAVVVVAVAAIAIVIVMKKKRDKLKYED